MQNESKSALFPVDVIGFDETRQIDVQYGKDGNAVEAKPIEGSDRAFLDLRLPDGGVIRAEVSHEDFEARIVPLFAAP
jgi:hypothetical protein